LHYEFVIAKAIHLKYFKTSKNASHSLEIFLASVDFLLKFFSRCRKTSGSARF